MQEILLLPLHADVLGNAFKLEVVVRQEGAVAEVVLRLFVDKGSHLAGFTTDASPLGQRLLHGNAVALPLSLGG